MNASPESHDPASSSSSSSSPSSPSSFHARSSSSSVRAASTALNAISEAVRAAQARQPTAPPEDEPPEADQALAALLRLRELREQLAGWEPGLIEAARAAGSSWADLAHPLGVASRQAAERRYLRVRPGKPGATGEQRVRATRDRRAADRAVTAWARSNAAELRGLAGQVTALADLPASSRASVARLADALAADDAAHLIDPLSGTHAHLAARHPALAARVAAVTRHADRLRQVGDDRRNHH